MKRQTVVIVHLSLVGGLAMIVAAFGTLFWLETAPLLRSDGAELIAYALSAMALGPILLGWAWARPRIPARAAETPVETYWRDPANGGRSLLLWTLWDGGAITGAVGTLLTGSFIPAAAGLVGFALLITHGPGYLESR